MLRASPGNHVKITLEKVKSLISFNIPAATAALPARPEAVALIPLQILLKLLAQLRISRAMSCHVLSCPVLSCHVISSYALLCSAVQTKTPSFCPFNLGGKTVCAMPDDFSYGHGTWPYQYTSPCYLLLLSHLTLQSSITL